MKYMAEITAEMKGLNSYLDMMKCFTYSATTLYADAADGLKKNKEISTGCLLDDKFHHQNFIVAFFLLRHALELGIKVLINEHENFDHGISSLNSKKNSFIKFFSNVFCWFGLIKNNKKGNDKLYGHDLKKLWKNVNKNYLNDAFKAEVQKGFDIIKKYKLLKCAELIRYHVDNKGNQVKDLPPIETEDFEELLGSVNKVQFAVHEVLEAIRQRKYQQDLMKGTRT